MWGVGRGFFLDHAQFASAAPRRFCRRCGAEIATANLMDADPGIDREYFSLALQGGGRRQLSPTE